MGCEVDFSSHQVEILKEFRVHYTAVMRCAWVVENEIARLQKVKGVQSTVLLVLKAGFWFGSCFASIGSPAKPVLRVSAGLRAPGGGPADEVKELDA